MTRIYRSFVAVILLLAPSVASSQGTLSGTVQSGEVALTGATVKIINTFRAVSTGPKGEFSFGTLSPGNYEVEISFIGYQQKKFRVVMENQDVTLHAVLEVRPFQSDEVLVTGTRAGRAPVAVTNVNAEELSRNNLGQDLPVLLNALPSVVSTSDAGNGIGYTGLRIRGSDATRVNVTINGIPFNDAESQGSFFVDLPDLASSLQSVQVQRGVGTSTNGAGAFGGSLNLQTSDIRPTAFGVVSNSFGSFNTRKHTLNFGSGLIRERFYVEGRLSRISSDGYVDRARADLSGYFLQGAHAGKNSLLKILAFGGREETYQAWYGIDSASMLARRTRNFAGEIYDAAYNVTGTYDNQVDHYDQDHYQVHYSRRISAELHATAALHYTYGRGYYEEFVQDQQLADYNLPPVSFGQDTLFSSDLVRRRWLDNDFYGATWNLAYRRGAVNLTLGGGYNIYDGAHFGEITWMRAAGSSMPGHEFYRGRGLKTDFNSYIKGIFLLSRGWELFADLQVRKVRHDISGTDNGNVPLGISAAHSFFNPKGGISRQLSERDRLYLSYAIAHKEPTRTDYLSAEPGKMVKPERLGDLEAGYTRKAATYLFEMNGYLMNYRNQLVLTGEIDDVGAFVRRNVGRSYRSGMEFQLTVQPHPRVLLSANYTWSRNINLDYVELLGDSLLETPRRTKIAYSPSAIGSLQLQYKPVTDLAISVISKYVGMQFLTNDNTDGLTLPAYMVSDFRLEWGKGLGSSSRLALTLLVNNIFNTEYISNGFAWEGTPYYFPQAGRNFLAGITLSF